MQCFWSKSFYITN